MPCEAIRDIFNGFIIISEFFPCFFRRICRFSKKTDIRHNNILVVTIFFIVTDLLGAFGHWLMDSYGSPKTPILGKYIFEPNIHHHSEPSELIEHNWIELISTSLFPTMILSGIVCLIWEINWQVLLGTFFLANANLIHKWCHSNKEEKPRVIFLLQKAKVLQTPEHHALHHLGNQDRYYAAFTNLTNPVLEYFNIWSPPRIEWYWFL